ncbi:MAG: GTP-binding protein, partial [Desulfuromonadaceae bacterium]
MITKRHTLRFIICGSVNDGTSTLIERLLHESKPISDDQLSTFEKDSLQYDTQGDQIAFDPLVDGLQTERKQGIILDVAYHFFATEHRRFIVVDPPGHEQYTRNMATAASTADLAVILIDARKGVLPQTRRHSRIVSMMGIRHVALVINKMDLAGFSEATFSGIVAEFIQFTEKYGFLNIQAIPLSALAGDNIVVPSPRTPWYSGPSLLTYLDSVETDVAGTCQGFRMPVQCVNRPNPDFCGFCGRVAQGEVRPGDAVRILPSGITSRVKEIVAWQGSLNRAGVGEAVTLTLADEIDISRGDMIVSADDPPQVSDQFEARLLWMSEQPLLAGRPYLIKLHSKEVTVTVSSIKYCEDMNSGAHLAARSLGLNEIGVVNISLNQAVVFEPFGINRTLGGFILIDKL